MENLIDISDLSPEDVKEVLGLIKEKRAKKNGNGGEKAQESTPQAFVDGDRDDELLRRMAPQQRQLYEEIMDLRDMAGSGDFDIVEELRKIRQGH